MKAMLGNALIAIKEYQAKVAFLSTATFILSFPFLQAEAVPNNNQSFEQWCLQRKSLPTETKKTVEVLLKKAGTQDCKLADSRLKSFTILKMAFDEISDLKPIASLTNLLELDLTQGYFILKIRLRVLSPKVHLR